MPAFLHTVKLQIVSSHMHTHTHTWKVLSLALHMQHLMLPSHLCDGVTQKGLCHKALHIQEEVSGSKLIPSRVISAGGNAPVSSRL